MGYSEYPKKRFELGKRANYGKKEKNVDAFSIVVIVRQFLFDGGETS